MDLYHQERLADCQQLMEDGNCTNPNQYYGILTARIYFSNDCLFVEVLCARDVVPLDNNGKIYTIYIDLYVCKSIEYNEIKPTIKLQLIHSF